MPVFTLEIQNPLIQRTPSDPPIFGQTILCYECSSFNYLIRVLTAQKLWKTRKKCLVNEMIFSSFTKICSANTSNCSPYDMQYILICLIWMTRFSSANTISEKYPKILGRLKSIRFEVLWPWELLGCIRAWESVVSWICGSSELLYASDSVFSCRKNVA